MRRTVMTWVHLVAAGILLTCSNPAAACVVPTPPFEPMAQPSDTVLLGRVVNRIDMNGRVRAEIAVQRVISGSYKAKSYGLEWRLYDGPGMCPPNGPNLKQGDEVVVYLQSGVVRGWMFPRHAAATDMRLRNVGYQPFPTMITDPVWVRRPSPGQLAKAFPKAAKLRSNGSATLRCLVKSDGALADCAVIGEFPVGQGFGAAALTLAPAFQMRATTRDGTPAIGRSVRVPIAFVRN